jgi:DNA-binding LacI/PurR family transcriptional regulator
MRRASKSFLPPAGAKPASLRTIADHLGLSTAAVSRVLSGAEAAKSIPAATQKKIHDAAALFNYRANVLARSLRSRRSLTVGVMVPEVSEGYATLVLSGIEQRLLDAGFFYFVVSHHHRPELIERYPELLLARAVEGLIAIDTPLTHRLDVPTVTVSGHHEPPGVTNILLNHRRAAALAIDHLAALRHRRIAFIQGQAFSSDTRPRWNAIRQAISSAGLRIDPAFVTQLEGDAPTHEPGYLATQRLLAAQAKLPRSRHFTALFAFNDISAIGAIRAIREAGLRVPEDVSVIGFDDVQSAAFQNPALTTVRQPLQQMGQLAAQTVLNQIENLIQARDRSPSPPIVPRHINRLVEPELICRNSTAPALPIAPSRPA